MLALKIIAGTKHRHEQNVNNLRADTLNQGDRQVEGSGIRFFPSQRYIHLDHSKYPLVRNIRCTCIRHLALVAL